MKSFSRRAIRSFGVVALFLAAALFGTAGGVIFAFIGDLPQIAALDDYSPGTITKVLGSDGSTIGDFATERRVVVTSDQIPAVLRNAMVASEDGNFFQHSGIDVKRIGATIVRRVLGMQRRGGASTITQQLARKLFLTDEVTPERKIKEWLLALQIEKRYTKEEILTMYLNKMYWGHGAYGVEAASQLYFAKHVSELNLDEAAMIAGIHQSNARQSPYNNMAAARTRRNYALERMAARGYITAAEAEAAKARPIVTRGEPSQPASIAPYFLESVRQRLEDQYGAKALYQDGLTVRTGLDPDLQRAANHALDAGLRRVDQLKGFRKPTRNILTENPSASLESFRHPRWVRDPVEGDIATALVMSAEGSDIVVRVGKWTGTIGKDNYKWTNKKPQDLVRRGDIIEVRLIKRDDKASTFTARLDQVPLVEGAVLAIDNHSGQILAMIGGDSFERSKFNRATQALRQVGSLYKPFVYTAAIDKGYTATSTIVDEPVSFNVGPGQPAYEPKNYDREYHGTITLRTALEGSRNVPTIKLMAALGPPQVNEFARQLGITSPLPNYLSVAIGAAEASLLEMTSAYTAFPNQGVRMEPTLILDVADREGNTLEQHRPQPHEAIRADTAYIITNLLHGVVENGTARKALVLDWPVGGKTGTTDDYTDAWFVGFDPNITIGVWVGLDQKKPIGVNQTGTEAALPIWIEIMKSWVERQRAKLAAPPEFERPGNIVTVGNEAYIAGTEPGGQGGQVIKSGG